tara:strand:+ start:593 stop:1186 length:594 start_codon:yes stop_codon:yes gene_type:complete
MTPAFEALQNILKKLPGLGYRSAERIALNLLVEKPDQLKSLIRALEEGADKIKSCLYCGNITEDEICSLCENESRNKSQLCVVEQVPDLIAFEKAGAYNGLYHVLHGKLSPLQGISPDDLNIAALEQRILHQEFSEVILALTNDIEGEATCHYLQENLFKQNNIRASRIAFGLPSGGGLVYADPSTLQSALQGRREF